MIRAFFLLALGGVAGECGRGGIAQGGGGLGVAGIGVTTGGRVSTPGCCECVNCNFFCFLVITTTTAVIITARACALSLFSFSPVCRPRLAGACAARVLALGCPCSGAGVPVFISCFCPVCNHFSGDSYHV